MLYVIAARGKFQYFLNALTFVGDDAGRNGCRLYPAAYTLTCQAINDGFEVNTMFATTRSRAVW